MPYVEYDEVEAICSDCGRIFHSPEALEGHRLESHDLKDRASAPPVAPTVNCSVCHREFRSAITLAEHNRRSHTG